MTAVHPAERVAKSFSFQVFPTPAGTSDEIEHSLKQLAEVPHTGLIVLPDAFTSANADEVIE
jgi:hypothetical protein